MTVTGDCLEVFSFSVMQSPFGFAKVEILTVPTTSFIYNFEHFLSEKPHRILKELQRSSKICQRSLKLRILKGSSEDPGGSDKDLSKIFLKILAKIFVKIL